MNSNRQQAAAAQPPLAEIKLVVREDLCRAFQRCVWMQVQESGRTQLEIMDEVVRDFLRKYGC